ncbi:MAG TPA: VCBS repeat-containing protein [Bacteroidetes bacterium]|nr:VCBS repeat-containing protein [Bacteroidota bacterium]
MMLFVLFAGIFCPVIGQSTFGLPQLAYPAFAFGMHDQDSFPDVLASGLDANGNIITEVYDNVSGTSFSSTSAGLTKVWRAAAAWADYDNDGREDLFVCGDQGKNTFVSKLYRNVGGVLTPTSDVFEGYGSGSTFWADLDNDSDLDLFITGLTNRHGLRSVIYENTGSGFREITDSAFIGLEEGDADFGDFDNDGDLDIVISGVPAEGGGRVMIFENQGGMVFSPNHNSFRGLHSGSSRFMDVDGDNDLDLVTVGASPGFSAEVYQFDGSSFLASRFMLTKISRGVAAEIDYNLDGLPDVILCGSSKQAQRLEVYRNIAGESFQKDQLAYPLGGMSNARIYVRDMNKDGYPDFLVAGHDAGEIPRTYIYRYFPALTPPRFQ